MSGWLVGWEIASPFSTKVGYIGHKIVLYCMHLFVFLQSLAGHTSPVDAVKFNGSEDTVIAGSLSGALKIWDLESVKSRHLFVGCIIRLHCMQSFVMRRLEWLWGINLRRSGI